MNDLNPISPDGCDHEPKRGSAAPIGECVRCGTNEHTAAGLGEPFWRHTHEYVGGPIARCECGAWFTRRWVEERHDEALASRARRLERLLS